MNDSARGTERSTDDIFCIISHQVTNGFELVRISGGNGHSWFARWGVFSSKLKKKGIDCRTLPGFTLMAAARKSDGVRAEFSLVEFIKSATIEQIAAIKSVFCIFVVGDRIDSLCADIRRDNSKIPPEDRSGRTAGPASGRRIKDKIPPGTFRATT